MWEWREDTARGRWRLSSTGSWLWDEPSDLDRYAEGRSTLTRPLPVTAALPTPARNPFPGDDDWVGRPPWADRSWAEPTDAWPEAAPRSATPSWLAERTWAPVDDATIGSRPYLHDHARTVGGWGWMPDDVPADLPVLAGVSADLAAGRAADLGSGTAAAVESTPIFEAVAEDRDGGGGAHAARTGDDADHEAGDTGHPAIPSPTPGSGPLPVQRLEALRGSDSPEEELRRRAERRRRPIAGAAAGDTGDAPIETGRHALVGTGGRGGNRADDATAPAASAGAGAPAPGAGRHGRA